MKHNFDLIASSSVFVTILLVILNCCLSFGQNDVVLNQTNNDNMGPTLLGVFNDGVNHSQNASVLLDSDNIDSSSKTFNDKEGLSETIALKTDETSILINHNENISASAPQIDYDNNNSGKSVTLSNDDSEDHNKTQELNNTQTNDWNIDHISSNETQGLNLCKLLKFNQESNDHIREEPICILSAQSGPPASSAYFASSSVQSNIFPTHFHIPDPIEKLSENIYLKMMVNICCGKGCQLLIYDQVSKNHLLSFHNSGTAYRCNHWKDQNYETLVTDSTKIRVEMVFPSDSTGQDPTYEYTFIDHKESTYGKRIVASDGFNLEIIYFEVPFTNLIHELEAGNENDTYREALYIPNSVITYKLKNRPNFNKTHSLVGVRIDLEWLDIDIYKGDFVLIGAGSEPMRRELSKAQIIAQNIEKKEDSKKIWVNADSAYICLVTHNSLKDGTALKFSWRPPTNSVAVIDDSSVPLRVKEDAIQICILDHSCQKMDNTFRRLFIDEFVHIANEYLAGSDDDATTLVSSKSVLLFGGEEGVRQHEYKSEIFCQINLAITNVYDDQWPMLPYDTLHHIFFRGSDRRRMHSFGDVIVTDCSYESISLWQIILPIVVILIVSILLMSIAWRYQYLNWMRSQRIENAKYAKTQINDDNENTLYTKDTKNPIFVDADSPVNIRKPNAINKTTDVTDSNFISNNEQRYVKKRSQTSEVLAMLPNQPVVNREPEFVDSLWANPSTSHERLHQNPPEYNHQLIEQKISDNNQDIGSDRPTRDTHNIIDRTMSSSSDTIPSKVNPSIAGLHGTQHESLRSYPRSALRRSRAISENEYVIGPDGPGSPKLAKVQFELPLRPQLKGSPLLRQDSSGSSIGFENSAFVHD